MLVTRIVHFSPRHSLKSLKGTSQQNPAMQKDFCVVLSSSQGPSHFREIGVSCENVAHATVQIEPFSHESTPKSKQICVNGGVEETVGAGTAVGVAVGSFVKTGTEKAKEIAERTKTHSEKHQHHHGGKNPV